MPGVIEERQNEFVELFNELDDWLWQYELLLQIAGDLEDYPSDKKTDRYLVAGCQSKAWVYCICEDNKMRVFVESDALIIKGMMGVVVSLLNGTAPDQAALADIDFIERTALKDQISTDRFNGMQHVIKLVQDYARAAL